MTKIENWGSYPNKTYKEPNMNKRKEILGEYKNIDNLLTKFKDGGQKLSELSSALGRITSAENDEHASSQLYAYDNLLKLTQQTEEDADTDTITEEGVFDIAIEKNPMKRAYLLGMLYRFSSLEKAKTAAEELDRRTKDGEAEDSPEIIKMKEQIAAIKRVRESIKRLGADAEIAESEEMKKVIEYIINDYPEGVDECEAAKLIAKYYENEENATRMPSIGEKLLSLVPEEIWLNRNGNKIPRYPYTLPNGKYSPHHPSQEKLDEYDEFRLPFTTVPAVEIEGVRYWVKFPLNQNLNRAYLRRIRYYKDQGNYDRVNLLEQALKERVWRELQKNQDDPEIKTYFSTPEDKDNLVVLRQTVRDWPEDDEIREILMKELDEKKDKKEDVKPDEET